MIYYDYPSTILAARAARTLGKAFSSLARRHQTRTLLYWRDKQHHEVDFVWAPRRGDPTAIEVKWSARQFDPSGILAFRRLYPSGRNLVVCHDVHQSYKISVKKVSVEFVGLEELVARLAA